MSPESTLTVFAINSTLRYGSFVKLALCCLISLAAIRGAGAVEIDSQGDYQVTTSSTPGADYVGQIGGPQGAAGTYLGDGYVLTAAHIGPGDFMLDGVSYTPVAGSSQSFTTYGATVNGVFYPTATADLTLFQITGNPLPSLPPLTIAPVTPSPYISGVSNGTAVVMIGYGDSANVQSYGIDQVTEPDQTVNLYDGQTPPTYISYDFVTDDGTFTGSSTFTNNAQLIPGDSGGGDFIVLPGGGLELAGINEVYFTDVTNGPPVASGMVDLSYYADQIDAITGIPEPSAWLLALGGLAAIFLASFQRRTRISAY